MEFNLAPYKIQHKTPVCNFCFQTATQITINFINNFLTSKFANACSNSWVNFLQSFLKVQILQGIGRPFVL